MIIDMNAKSLFVQYDSYITMQYSVLLKRKMQEIGCITILF